MIQKPIDIPLSGLSTSPSDILAGDGSLSAAINVTRSDGSIHPAFETSPSFIAKSHVRPSSLNIGDIWDEQIIYAHHNAGYTHYIVKYSSFDMRNMGHGNMIPSEATEIGYVNDSDISSGTDLIPAPTSIIALPSDLDNIIAIGNILILYANGKPNYYLWSESRYKSLGSKIPEMQLFFDLKLTKYQSHTHTSDVDDDSKDESEYFTFNRPIEDSRGVKTIDFEERTQFSNYIFSKVNRFTGDFCTKHGLYSQPFIVRYAYRLFDNSLSIHSAPILMLPVNGCNPVVSVIEYSREDVDKHKIRVNCQGVSAELFFRVGTDKGVLNDWKDIVRSVDIFISKPLFTFKQGLNIDNFTIYNKFRWESGTNLSYVPDLIRSTSSCLKMSETFSVGQRIERTEYSDRHEQYVTTVTDQGGVRTLLDRVSSFAHSTCPDFTMTHDDSDALILGYGSCKITCKQYGRDDYEHNVWCTGKSAFFNVDLHSKSDKDIEREINECGLFYLLKSIPISELPLPSDGSQSLTPSDDYLTYLEQKEQMSDDYDSYHTIYPKFVYSYNSRLNLANVSKTYFQGFSADGMAQECNIEDVSKYTITPVINITNNGDNISVVSPSATFDQNFVPAFIFYPDLDAKSIDLIVENSEGTFVVSLEMARHKFVNGSYIQLGISNMGKEWWKSYDYRSIGSKDSFISSIQNRNDASLPFTLYTSNPLNPFTFQASNVEDVGAGRIIALCPLAIPVSQGQFGYASMVAFTTDGNWALDVNATGGWRAKQPISYDVLLDERPESILQVNRNIVFATDRGLMMITGSTSGNISTDCISEIFDGLPDACLSPDGSDVPCANVHMRSRQGQVVSKTFLSHILESVLKEVYKSEYASIASDASIFTPFRTLLHGSIMAFDYTHQRILVGNPLYRCTYVYNMRDKMWTSLPLRLHSVVNSYPQCLINLTALDGSTRIFADATRSIGHGNGSSMPATISNAAEIGLPHCGFLLTRPLKMGLPTTLKTLRTLNVHGNYRRPQLMQGGLQGNASVNLIVYGSNDPTMRVWFPVASRLDGRIQFTTGTPYKYFRVAILSRLLISETIHSLSAEFDARETHKLRT